MNRSSFESRFFSPTPQTHLPSLPLRLGAHRVHLLISMSFISNVIEDTVDLGSAHLQKRCTCWERALINKKDSTGKVQAERGTQGLTHSEVVPEVRAMDKD